MRNPFDFKIPVRLGIDRVVELHGTGCEKVEIPTSESSDAISGERAGETIDVARILAGRNALDRGAMALGSEVATDRQKLEGPAR